MADLLKVSSILGQVEYDLSGYVSVSFIMGQVEYTSGSESTAYDDSVTFSVVSDMANTHSASFQGAMALEGSGAYSLGVSMSDALNLAVSADLSPLSQAGMDENISLGSVANMPFVEDAYTDNPDEETEINADNIRQIISVTKSGSYIRICLKGSLTANVTLIGVSMGERSGSTGNYATAPTRITFNNGSSSVVLPKSTTIYSDWFTFTLNKSKTYLLHYAIDNPPNYFATKNKGALKQYYSLNSTDDTMTQVVTGYSTSSLATSLVSIQIATAPVHNAIIEALTCAVEAVMSETGVASMHESLLLIASGGLSGSAQQAITDAVNMGVMGASITIDQLVALASVTLSAKAGIGISARWDGWIPANGEGSITNWVLNIPHAGPWQFTAQPDKPHYNEAESISNPPASAAHPIIDPVWKTPDQWHPDRITTLHHPWCGYWTHRQETGGVMIYLAAKYYEATDIPNSGIVVLKYDPSTDGWTWIGDFLGVLPGSTQAGGALRVASDESFAAYFSNFYDDEENTDDRFSCITFVNGVATEHVLEAGTDSSYSAPFENTTSMDIHDSGLIACLIEEYVGGGSPTQGFIRCYYSSDKGTNWAYHDFPVYGDAVHLDTSASVRIDALGNIWVFYLDPVAETFLIYKSTDSGANWTNTCTQTLSDLPSWGFYSIDDSGQYQYVILLQTAGATETFYVYASTDYGATFTEIEADDPDMWNCLHASNVDRIVWPAKAGTTFRESASSGASFLDVSAGETIRPTLGFTASVAYDIQNDDDAFAYTEDNRLPFGDSYLGILYSTDNGATWTKAVSPLFANYYVAVPAQTINDANGVAHTYNNWWYEPSVDVIKTT